MKHIPEEIRSTKNLPTIYFACHPDDRVYMSEIADRIFAVRRCVIIYEDDYGADYDEKELRLKLQSVQLMIFPVTSKLLSEPCRAMDVEYKIACEAPVTIMPVILESGIEREFEAKFGRVHALNKQNEGKFAIPYEEQMKRYLDMIFVSDDTEERIRKAFDTQIFISYRKLDMQSAVELMNLIHENDEFRDVAIWYDNYIYPGERYDDEITDAIDRSSAVLFVVTPNFYRPNENGEENYVQTFEVPYVRKSKRTSQIIPVEMIRTDVSDVSDDIILRPVDRYYAAQSLGMALAANGVTLRRNTDDSEHEYLIGLAYLNGIGVEKNKNIAVDAITRSAEAGYAEAVVQLAHMYREGIGVQRDFDLYVKWYTVLIDIFRTYYMSEGTADSCAGYTAAMIEMAEALSANDRDYQATTYLDEIVRLCNRFFGAEGLTAAENDALKHNLISAYYIMGDILFKNGRAREAYERYSMAGEIIDSLCQATDDTERQTAQLVLMMKQSGVLCYIGRTEESSEILLTVARRATDLLETEENQRLRLMISECYTKVGDIMKDSRKYREAAQYLTVALNNMSSSLSITGDAMVLYQISNSMHSLGQCFLEEGETDSALKYVRRSLGLAIKINKQYGTPSSVRDVASECDLLAAIYMEKKRYRLANHCMTLAYNMMKKVESASDTADTRLSMATACHDLAITCDMLGRKDEYTRYLNESMTRFEDICKDTGHIPTLLKLGKMLATFGYDAQIRGDSDEAVKWYRRAIDNNEKLMAEDNSVPVRENTAKLYYVAAQMHMTMKPDFAKARGYIAKAVAIYEQLMRENDATDTKSFMADCYTLAAGADWGLHSFKSARENALSAIKIYEELLKKRKNEDREIQMRIAKLIYASASGQMGS